MRNTESFHWYHTERIRFHNSDYKNPVSPDSKEPDENNEKCSGKMNHTLLNQPQHRKRIPKVKCVLFVLSCSLCAIMSICSTACRPSAHFKREK